MFTPVAILSSAAASLETAEATGLGLQFWTILLTLLLLFDLLGFLIISRAVVSVASRAKLRAAADRGEEKAAQVLELIEDRKGVKRSLRLAAQIVGIMATTLSTMLLAGFLPPAGLLLAVAITGVILVVLYEVLRQTCAYLSTERMLICLAPLIRLSIRMVAPPAAMAGLLLRGAVKLLGGYQEQAEPDFTPQEEIAGALALGHSSGSMPKEERDRLLGALDLGDHWVEEIMLHRSEIEMIDADQPLQEVLAKVLGSAHTRLPVYRNERENVIGVIHSKDLLRAVNGLRRECGDFDNDFDIMKIAMPAYFVPDTTPLDEQLRAFLDRRTHFALVVDEYGSLRGLITLEDILEEIVGEIVDEHDRQAGPQLKPNRSGEYIVDGAMTIRDINRALEWHLPDEEANTIAGLVIHIAQSIPIPGQVFLFDGFCFEVLAKRENRITRLRIRPPQETTSGEGDMQG